MPPNLDWGVVGLFYLYRGPSRTVGKGGLRQGELLQETQWLRKISSANVPQEDFLNELITGSLDPSDLSGVDFYIARVKGRHVDPALFPEKTGGNRRVLWHTADEKLRHRGQMYKNFDAVIRNYFDPRMGWNKKIVTFPLGYLSGSLGDPDTRDRSRAHRWAFCGSDYKQRKEMLEAFSRVPGGFVHIASGWTGAKDALSQDELVSLYRDSDFVLCPPGVNHFDTFRIMEALQAGAVPVVTEFLGRDYAKYTFGDHPFVVAKSWGEAADILIDFQKNPDKLALKKQETIAWYEEYRRELFTQFRLIITTGAPTSKQWDVFSFQRRACWDVVFLYRVWRRFHPSYKKKRAN